MTAFTGVAGVGLDLRRVLTAAGVHPGAAKQAAEAFAGMAPSECLHGLTDLALAYKNLSHKARQLPPPFDQLFETWVATPDKNLGTFTASFGPYALRLQGATFGIVEALAGNGRQPGDAPHNLPVLNAADGDIARLSEDTWQALCKANNPPALFRYAGGLSRLERTEDGSPVLRAITEDRMTYAVNRSANWFRGAGTEWDRTSPPRPVIRDMLARPKPPLPTLDRIVEAPVFARSGELQTVPGYHPASRTYYAPAEGFTVPSVREAPSAADVARARGLLTVDLLGDFPFVEPPNATAGNAELAHAVALILLPFARDLIDGPTPLHVIEKPQAGTGASLLVDVSSLPACGRSPSIMTEGRDEDEWRKRLHAKLRTNPAATCIDNLRHKLDSATVAAALTARVWEDRVLGTSETERLPIRCAWVATGNNPAFSDEITRRIVRIRLDAKTDQPWLRAADPFRYPNLRDWALEHRSVLVWACLVLVRAWLAGGRPKGTRPLGMYEDWAGVMGGILQVAGINGFLTNLEGAYSSSNYEREQWELHVSSWSDLHGEKAVGVGDVLTVITANNIGIDVGSGDDHQRRVRLGLLLRQARDRQFAGLRITAGKKVQRAQQWQLVSVAPCADQHSHQHSHAEPASVQMGLED